MAHACISHPHQQNSETARHTHNEFCNMFSPNPNFSERAGFVHTERVALCFLLFKLGVGDNFQLELFEALYISAIE
jgi:hypothetical protein